MVVAESVSRAMNAIEPATTSNATTSAAVTRGVRPCRTTTGSGVGSGSVPIGTSTWRAASWSARRSAASVRSSVT